MRIPFADQHLLTCVPKKLSSITTFLAFLFFSSFMNSLIAEGSKDFINYPGYRMFLDTRDTQQMKVFVNKDEFINIGSSHLGIQGGYINIYRPDGVLHATLTGNNGNEGIIFNKAQEVAGPTGNGNPGSVGYEPWYYKVQNGQEGVWTVYFGFPTYSSDDFANILNNADWNRAQHQPNFPKVVLAWDITVSKMAAGNNNGQLISGRLYTNEYITVISQNGFKTSPTFNILTKDGFVFEVKIMDADPFRFPISSNNIGFAKSNIEPVYSSQPRNMVTKSIDPTTWTPGIYYLYEPQANDYNNGLIVNNKIFFNEPDKTLPERALTSDVFRKTNHETWLLNVPQSYTAVIDNFEIIANDDDNNPCDPGSIQVGEGAQFSFKSNVSGTATLLLDQTEDGDFNDPKDRVIYSNVNVGDNIISWDGKDGEGNPLSIANDFQMSYLIKVRGGETHILLTDVENNEGGVSFEMANNQQPGIPTDFFYYDHTPIGGTVSGGGLPGNPMPTNVPYTYNSNFGNNKILDYWAFFDYAGQGSGTLVFDISDNCNDDPPMPPSGPDKDMDGIPDIVDIDDDNDGIPDKKEYCNPGNGFACLPGGFDPSIDLDGDGVPNFMDANDPAFTNPCTDSNSDGVCDQVAAIFDTDGDGIADHWDLDSDNDGISDLVEAGHEQPDADGNGVIDGLPAIFGLNGLYNPIASDPDDINAIETYTRFDVDKDGVPDHDDLDSDNDGINDVAEAGYSSADTNNDGRIDNGAGQPPLVGQNGLAPIIDPAVTGVGIPLPPDHDGDNVPDWHDLDSDNDNINDVAETNKSDSDNNGRVGTGIPPINIYGQATTIIPTSVPTDTDGDGIPDFKEKDSDGDGINDVIEANQPDPDFDGVIGIGIPTVDIDGLSDNFLSTSKPTDSDANGIADFQQLDSDNDGILDIEECPTSTPCRDWDNDLTPDFQDPDRDDDGIFDGYECETGFPCPDTDNDGIPDVDDLDTDGDMLSDTDECPLGNPCPDANFNGIPEWREYFCNPNIAVPVAENVTSTGTMFCAGASVSLNAENSVDVDGDSVTYQWIGPNGFDFTTITTEFGPFPVDVTNMTSQNAGTYTLYLFTDAGCVGTPGYVTLEIADNPETPSLNIEEDILCVGQMLELNSTIIQGGNIQYEWWFNNGNGIVSLGVTNVPTFFIDDVTTANIGDYNVSVLSGSCTSQLSNSQNVTVDNVIAGLTPYLNIEEDFLCEGQTIELNSSPYAGQNVQYHWWFNDGLGNVSLGITDAPTFFIPDATATNSGIYSVMIFSGNCSSQMSNLQDIEVNNELAGILPSLFVNTDVLCDGETIELNSTAFPGQNINYIWWFDNGNGASIIASTDVPTLFIPNATADNTGVYSVSVTMGLCQSNLSNEQDIAVSNSYAGQTPALSVVEDNPCEGDFIELNSSILQGGNVSYNWYFDNGNGPNLLATTNLPTYFINNVTPDNTGIYTVTASFGNCETQFSNAQDITVTNDLTNQTPVISINESVLCDGEMLELNSTVVTGINVVYEWWFNDGTGAISLGITTVPTYFISNVSSTNSGVYEVTFSVGNCTSQFSNSQDLFVTDDLTDQTPVLTINETSLCDGEMLELNSSIVSGGNVTYEWFFDNGSGIVSMGITNLPTFFINNVTTSNAGVYTVQASVGNCSSQFSNAQDVAISNSLDSAPVLSIVSTVICEGETLELNSSMLPGNNVVYHWYFNDGTGLFEIGSTDIPTFYLNNIGIGNAGIYMVSISIGGCTSQPSNAQDIAVQSAPDLDITNTTDSINVACIGDLIELNAPMVLGASYQWAGPQGFAATSVNPVIENAISKNAGDYYVVVSKNGCEFISDPTTVYVFDGVRAEDDDFQITEDDSLTMIDFMENDVFGNVENWKIKIANPPINGTLTLDANNQLVYHPRVHFSGDDVFIYEICNTDCPDQCDPAVVTVRVFSNNENEPCFVPNIITPNDDGANDFFTVPCLESEFTDNNLKIFNRWGDLVYEAQPYKNNWAGTYRNVALPPGTYFYVLQLDRSEEEFLQGYFTITR